MLKGDFRACADFSEKLWIPTSYEKRNHISEGFNYTHDAKINIKIHNKFVTLSDIIFKRDEINDIVATNFDWIFRILFDR